MSDTVAPIESPTDVAQAVSPKKKHGFKNCKYVATVGTLLTLLAVIIAIIFLLLRLKTAPPDEGFSEGCSFELTETLPRTTSKVKPTGQLLQDLIAQANKTIDISAEMFTLNVEPTQNGQEILAKLNQAAKRKVQIRIVEDGANPKAGKFLTTTELMKQRFIKVYRLNFTSPIFEKAAHRGRFMIIDNQIAYLGSAQFTDNSLTNVQETGIVVRSCPSVAKDLGKIFDTYVRLAAKDGSKPKEYKHYFTSSYPFRVATQNGNFTFYFTHASPMYTHESTYTAVVKLIESAKKVLDISISHYLPEFNDEYWGPIDIALRSAASRDVQVRILISPPNVIDSLENQYLTSLAVLPNIDVKIYRPPLFSKRLPGPTRTVINSEAPIGSKFIVTDDSIWIGNTDFTGDLLQTSTGVGVVISKLLVNATKITVVENLRKIFEKDFASKYAESILDEPTAVATVAIATTKPTSEPPQENSTTISSGPGGVLPRSNTTTDQN